jgi:hypothetical protein
MVSPRSHIKIEQLPNSPNSTGPNPRAAPAQRQVRQRPGGQNGQIGGPAQEAHQGDSQVAHLHVLARYVQFEC